MFVFRGNKIVSTLLSTVVIAINIFFVVYSAMTSLSDNIWLLTGIGFYSVVYLIMCIYLIIHMAISMGIGADSRLANSRVRKFIYNPEFITYEYTPTRSLDNHELRHEF